MTIAEFLLARIAEDEAVARAVQEAEPKSAAHVFTSLHSPTGTVEMSPTRVVADCEAKRRIVAADICTACYIEVQPCDHRIETLRALAAVYADHPDYDEAWRQ